MPIILFGKNRGRIDGLADACLECMRNYSRKYTAYVKSFGTITTSCAVCKKNFRKKASRRLLLVPARLCKRSLDLAKSAAKRFLLRKSLAKAKVPACHKTQHATLIFANKF